MSAMAMLRQRGRELLRPFNGMQRKLPGTAVQVNSVLNSETARRGFVEVPKQDDEQLMGIEPARCSEV